VVAYGDTLSALADPTRRSVFERLAGGPRSVAELALGFSVSRPAVSQHLRVLKDAGLVLDSREGTRRVYEINPDGLSALREYLDGFWGDALASFKAAAESETEEAAENRGGERT
jgi:DNA-binding transcriptional ArsR family regulator